ncbi:coiled-coil domain-containing protein 22-like [Lycorma delicatula]|uniref:coiled-coil domain-containing protein 22-like n=1 Tax=Lycorma delicatula TaxID=130591 RepID=UPI003F50F956
MEEVDKIIIHSLKDIGCDIDDETQSLQLFTAELVVEAAVRCLEIINDGKADLPMSVGSTLPSNMSARFKIGAAVAKACADLGYAGEMGYQTFLYPTDTELRKIFIFLLEKLPKEADKEAAQSGDGLPNLREAISDAVRSKLLAPWVKSRSAGQVIPFITVPLETGISLPGQKRDCTPQEWREYCVRRLPFIHEQLPVQDLLVPSLIAENSKGLLSQQSLLVSTPSSQTLSSSPSHCWDNFGAQQVASSRTLEQKSWFTLREKFHQKNDGAVNVKKLVQDNSVEKSDGSKTEDEQRLTNNKDIQKSVEERKEEERKELERLKEKMDELQKATRTVTSKLAEVEKESAKAEELVTSRQKEEEIRQKTLSLLPESNVNMTKLQALVDSSVQRLKTLTEQWEKHRLPLIIKYRESRQRVANKASESVRQQETARELREKLRELTEQVAAKEALQARLQGEIDKLPKDIVTRPAYTRRIMEIIGNIKKQCEVINNVVRDTKQLQKDINTETGRLERSFTVANELIFKDAKRDETARRAYKILAMLHSDFAELVEMVEETGAILREIRDLEEQIEVEMAKHTADNLERIMADLQQMRRETSAVSSKSHSKTSS